MSAINYGSSLNDLERYTECRAELSDILQDARSGLAADNTLLAELGNTYAAALQFDPDGSLEDMIEAIAIFEESVQVLRRVNGPDHPKTKVIEQSVNTARRNVEIARYRGLASRFEKIAIE